MSSSLKITEVLESALYVTDLLAAQRFYMEVLGLTFHARSAGRHVFLRCGNRMVLLFNAEATAVSAESPGDAPGHGAKGASHLAFAVRDSEIEQWKERLAEHGVAIEKEICWGGGRSIYFRDPSQNSVELATPLIWGISEDTLSTVE